jgi:riboflavin synthase
MFTGLIEAKGRISSSGYDNGAAYLCIEHEGFEEPVGQGDSVCVDGVCLTASRVGRHEFTCNVLEETFSKTTLRSRRAGDLVNLERALPAGGRLGGHIVTGHVDCVANVTDCRHTGKDTVIRFGLLPDLIKGVVEKGSVSCNGVSLTVCDLAETFFSVKVIPHTLQHTNLGALRKGDEVNIETDILGKYVFRALASAGSGGGLNLETLRRNGFIS